MKGDRDRVRLILDPPANGSWNMAVDQALLETAASTGKITVRFYQWSEPTLSLGYFQKNLDRNLHRASGTCSLVRRTTGGGAILHDHDLTYSICSPTTNRWSRTNQELVWIVHRAIKSALAANDVSVELYEEPGTSTSMPSSSPETAPPFLCFQRRSAGDLMLANHKIAGSAQRRKKSALLQHGSLLLRSSEFAPELLGVEDLSEIRFSGRDSITQQWVEELKRGLQSEWVVGTLTDCEIQAAKKIESTVFAAAAWNLRK